MSFYIHNGETRAAIHWNENDSSHLKSANGTNRPMIGDQTCGVSFESQLRTAKPATTSVNT